MSERYGTILVRYSLAGKYRDDLLQLDEDGDHNGVLELLHYGNADVIDVAINPSWRR